jgi:hypothetical protein
MGQALKRWTDWPGFILSLGDRVRNLLKAELKCKGVTIAQLLEKLSAIGMVEVKVNIRNKLAPDKFSAAFQAKCLTVIGSSVLRLD